MNGGEVGTVTEWGSGPGSGARRASQLGYLGQAICPNRVQPPSADFPPPWLSAPHGGGSEEKTRWANWKLCILLLQLFVS